MSLRTARFVGASLVAMSSALGVFAPREARADDVARAEALFQEARALVDKGDYAHACQKLEESQKLEPAVGTQFNLADCYEHVGKTASAYVLFRQVAGIARAAGKFEREQRAKERAATLEPKLARVRLVVAAPAPGLEVKIDDKAVDRSSSEPVPIDPGRHVVTASAPGRTTWQADATAVEARVVDIAIPELVDPTPKRAATVVIAPPPPSTQRTVALVAGGVGIAGLAVGAIAGAMALSERGNAERECPTEIHDFRCPTEAGAEAWNSAASAGNVSTIAFVAGGVVLAGAAVLWLTAPSAKARAGVTAGGLRLEGSF